MYKIETTKLMKEIMGNYFRGMKDSKKKIAWCTSVGPAELLRSFDFEVHFPENHGALLGATRTAGDFIPEAAKLGYSSEICSYLTADVGSYLKQQTPLLEHYDLNGPPKPDLIVYNTNQCREVQDWFTYFAREFNCPVFGITSPRHVNEVSKEDINDVASQFKAMIPICEQVSGNKFDIDKFKETIRLSKEATDLWKEVLWTASVTPSPISFFDATIHMGPIVVLRGTQTAKNYYDVLLEELKGNMDKGIGFLEKEKCRIYWEGMPIWGKLRSLSNLFLEQNAAVVASTYCNSWVFDDFDERNPFESSALAYTTIFINRSEEAKEAVLKKMIQDFRLDGIIFHEAKTCFNNSNSRFGMPARLKEETGVETLVIEGDLCDLRFFSEEQSTIKIETFLEQISS
ncbi:MAG: 2-hydroxyglutaryl-CoA dehydratase [Bacteroidetes bacterium]|nr:2-hydroxyglutaryl-CoA dehydratase [Bacteroidota bacterium]|tara:strand:+ start:2544 stop:3746 length:1203 start_codon:yes stop_codon:yes gene_type:complete